MTDYVQVPPNSTGEKICISQVSDGSGNNVDRQNVVLSDPSVFAAVAGVKDALPSTSDYGAEIRRVVSGESVYHVVSAATTNAANIKSSAGVVRGWCIFNNAAYPVYVKFYNTNGTPTAGTGVLYTIGIQAGEDSTVDLDEGLGLFSSGIGISITKGIADSDTTATAANDCVANIHYQ